MTPQSMVYIGFGILACFMGYSLFRNLLPLWGFLLGGWIAFTLVPTIIGGKEAGSILYQAIAFGVGGIIGAIIAVPLYFVIIFLSGGALGMIFGVMIGALVDLGGISSVRQVNAFLAMSFPPVPQTITQFGAMILLGLVMGVVAINFQKFMIIAASSLLGSVAIMTGFSANVFAMSATQMGRGAYMMIGWLVIGLLGMLIQFRLTGDT